MWPRASTCSAAAALAFALLPVASANSAVAARIYDVDDTTDLVDDAPGDGACHTTAGTCTLRAAVQEANAVTGRGVVVLPTGDFSLTLVGAGDDAGATGDLDVTGSLVLRGAGPGTVVRGLEDRVVHVLAGAGVTVERLTIAGGSVDGNGGGVLHEGEHLRLVDVLVQRNHAVGDGGGVYAGPGRLELVRTTLAGNTAENSGGGVAVSGPTGVWQSTLSGNRSEPGTGGGFRVLPGANLDIWFSTILHSASPGPGESFVVDGDGVVTATGSIISGVGRESDCDGTVQSGGRNMFNDRACVVTPGPGDTFFILPQLGPLIYAGGPTPVHVPTGLSFAVDTFPRAYPNCPERDQRNAPRPQDGDGDGVAACDRGAVER